MRSNDVSVASLTEATEPSAPSQVVNALSGIRKRSALLSCAIAIVTAAGCLGIFPELRSLWQIWTTDPLRSIGMVIPLASLVLTLRVWRQSDWEMRGSWWGLLVIALAYLLSVFRQDNSLFAVTGPATISLLPIALPVYVYGSGVVLLFAGMRVWCKAWFPLGLLLLLQPVPILSSALIDIPLQNISARVARSFATLIGFRPTTPQLRLMFSPDFGMFIAPGCDGIRGAVTMGYVALIVGYLKRASIRRWGAYVVGAVLLGYLFNLVRLCALVIYYRFAIGHAALENVAAQADYAIGSCLFLVAVFLFLWIVRRESGNPVAHSRVLAAPAPPSSMRKIVLRLAAFAAIAFTVTVLPSSAFKYTASAAGSPAVLASHMPRQVGSFALTRTWYEQQNGAPVIEAGAYSGPGSDEVVLAVWIASISHFHDPKQCWLARGLQPDAMMTKQYVGAQSGSIPLTTGFYNDGVTDSIVVNAYCTPRSCALPEAPPENDHVGVILITPQTGKFAGAAGHPISIMIRIDKLHGKAPKSVNYDLLSGEAEKFIAGLDLGALSRVFQN